MVFGVGCEWTGHTENGYNFSHLLSHHQVPLWSGFQEALAVSKCFCPPITIVIQSFLAYNEYEAGKTAAFMDRFKLLKATWL